MLGSQANLAEQMRRYIEPSKALRDAFDVAIGGSTMRLATDLILQDLARSQMFSSSIASTTIGSVLQANRINSNIFALQNISLQSIFGQLNTTRIFDEHQSVISALNTILGPAIQEANPVRSLLEGIGQVSVSQLLGLGETSAFRVARDAFARIELEESAFKAALPNVVSPWSAIDWRQLQKFMDSASAYAGGCPEVEQDLDQWDWESVSAEDNAELADAMREIAVAIGDAAVANEIQSEKQAEALSAILQYCGRLEAMLAKEKRSQYYTIIATLLVIFASFGKDLATEWAASHTTPALNRALGLLDQPVSAAEQKSMIRRDAKDAIVDIDLPIADVRYLRVVIRQSLPVFSEPKPALPPISRLCSGQVVAIVMWNKKWRLIEWWDSETGEYCAGWVRAKYIAKISR